MVYKTVGFSFDNIAAGFAVMGHTYLEILVNFTKRLFNWFVELFDHKIVPNVPDNNPKPPPTILSGKGLSITELSVSE